MSSAAKTEATVGSILIAPVKGMRVQSLETAEVSRDGLTGDRCFFLVDAKGVLQSISRFGPLATIVPDWDPKAGRLGLTFPSGEVVAAPVEPGEPEPVTFYDETVRPRPVPGPFSEAISEHCDRELRLMATPQERPGVDRGREGAVSVLGSGSMSRLEQVAAEAGHDETIDIRRFRMNFNLDGLDPHVEDEWKTVRIGEAEIRIEEKVGRCAATTRDPDGGNVDMKTLHYIVSYRRDVPSEEKLPFGVYASVTRPGTVRIGDPVVPVLD